MLSLNFGLVILMVGLNASAQDASSGDNQYSKQYANDCLKSISHAIVISSPNAGEQLAVPAADLTFFECNQTWDCHSEKAPQVTTFAPSILEKGSVSAIVTSDGKVLQINSNGSCILSSKKYESSYDFIAEQMKLKFYGDQMKRILNPTEKSYVAKKCGQMGPGGSTQNLYAALVGAHLIEPRTTKPATGEATTNK